MKKFRITILLISGLMLAHTLPAQTPAKTDTMKTNFSDIDRARDRIVLDLHWDGWLNSPDSMKVKGLSSGVGVHFYYDIPLNKTKTFSFAIGGGFSWSNYYNATYFTYDSTGNTIPTRFAEGITYKKNKFVINYFEVPLEFRYRTKPNNEGHTFKIAIGMKGGYVLSDHTKYVGADYIAGSSDEIKYKSYRVKNVNTLQYGPVFRFGLDKINLEAYYGLGTLFTEGKGPGGNPLTIGVSFNPF